MENKFFNNSVNTLTGKPKFMPPQKRHLLDHETQHSSPPQIPIDKPIPEKKNNNNISRNTTSEGLKQNTFFFKR